MSGLDHERLPEVIRQVRAAYHARGYSDWDIGNGLCEDFARDVLDQWLGDDWIRREGQGFLTVETGNFIIHDGDDLPIDWDWKLLDEAWGIQPPAGLSKWKLQSLAEDCPPHVWITVGRTHHDVETPDGVPSFFDLPFFRRHLDHL